MRSLVILVLCSWLAACAAMGQKAEGPTPSAAKPSPGPQASPSAPASGERPISPDSVPPPPPPCAKLVAHSPSPAACGATRQESLSGLADAIAITAALERDDRLAKLERCDAFPPGLVRALRAELADVACADAIVTPYLEAPPQQLALEQRDALLGLALAGQLSRLVHHPPVIEPPFSKARFKDFLRGPLGKWIAGQAMAVHRLALEGAKLRGYGKGIAAVEAGLADMRFVQVVREVPLPEELARDEELRDIYYIALDEALEPRKDRGRDAALVGLRVMATVGVLSDPRVDRARALLSKLYSGRRIDALDGLVLPPLPPAKADTVEQRLAAQLPTFYSGVVLRRADITEPAVMRALLERGVPEGFRRQLESRTVPQPTRRLYARALFGLGQRYWQSGLFAKAAQFAELGPSRGGPGADDVRLLGALATALQGGPRDAAEMMLRGPFLPAGVGNVAALDKLTRSSSPLAALAAFNAAYILHLVPPAEADPAFWEDLAARYGRAARQLRDPALVRTAQERQQAALETAAAVKQNLEQSRP